MISLETARKLKEAGMKWAPMSKDYFNYMNWRRFPRLDQLLAEIEARGIMYVLEWQGRTHHIRISDGVFFVADFEADSPEEAAAQGLLWILERGKEA